MNDGYEERLQAKLAPEAVGHALIQAGALLTGYELVKSSIVDGVRGFFTFGFTETGPTIGPDYERKVLALAPGNKFRASVAWLVEMDALQQEHVQALERIRTHRGEVAHELARLLVDPDASVDAGLLQDLRSCMRALDRFWGSIEVDINPDLASEDIDLGGIRSGSGLLLDYLLDLSGISEEPTDNPQ
jgi:hypothetical protein